MTRLSTIKRSRGRVVYLTILVILWLNFWDVVPFGHISKDAYYLSTMIYMVCGLLHFKPQNRISISGNKIKPIYFIFAGIFLSMIPAYLDFDQSLSQSIITYRVQYLWIVVPLLFRIAPTEKEVVKALFNVTLIMWGVYLLRLFSPELIVMDDEIRERLQDSERTIYLVGFTLPAIPLYYSLGQIKNDFSYKHILRIFVCYGYIFIMQNRSLLFPITLFLAFSLTRLKSRYRFISIIILSVVTFIFITTTYDTWIELLNISSDDIYNKDYNRNIAITYFLTANKSILNTMLGNGFISDKVSNIMKELMDMGIYNSDVGFIGYWNQFGIIPVITFLWLLIYALVKQNIPYHIKLWSAQILVCAFTISYFGASSEILFFSFFIYLLYYHKDINLYEKKEFVQSKQRRYKRLLRNVH